MEDRIITVVVEPSSKCRTSIRKKHWRKPERYREHADLPLLPDQERRPYKILGALLKQTQSEFWMDRC